MTGSLSGQGSFPRIVYKVQRDHGWTASKLDLFLRHLKSPCFLTAAFSSLSTSVSSSCSYQLLRSHSCRCSIYPPPPLSYPGLSFKRGSTGIGIGSHQTDSGATFSGDSHSQRYAYPSLIASISTTCFLRTKTHRHFGDYGSPEASCALVSSETAVSRSPIYHDSSPTSCAWGSDAAPEAYHI